MSDKAIKKKLIESREAVKKKFKSLKANEISTYYEQLEKTFQPIISPINSLSNVIKENINSPTTKLKLEEKENNYNYNIKQKKDKTFHRTKPVGPKPEGPKYLVKRKFYFSPSSTLTPKRLKNEYSLMQESGTEEENEEEVDAVEDMMTSDETEGESFQTFSESENFGEEQGVSGTTSEASEYIKKLISSEGDKFKIPFGVHMNNGVLYVGDSKLKFQGDKFTLKDHLYSITPGLMELFFEKNPNLNKITNNDKNNYRKIIEDTNLTRRGFQSDGQIQGDKSQKYSFIKKLFEKSGTGIVMKDVKASTNYVYWDDVNELVERIKLILSSKAAGHSGHNNEIISIIEELVETGVIEKPKNEHIKKILSVRLV